jgi:hypothetical protein
MNQKEHEEKLPIYEVEFIPAERRLRERRDRPESPVPQDRRNRGRRKTDAATSPEDHKKPGSKS